MYVGHLTHTGLLPKKHVRSWLHAVPKDEILERMIWLFFLKVLLKGLTYPGPSGGEAENNEFFFSRVRK